MWPTRSPAHELPGMGRQATLRSVSELEALAAWRKRIGQVCARRAAQDFDPCHPRSFGRMDLAGSAAVSVPDCMHAIRTTGKTDCMSFQHPTKRPVPRTVNIIALGPTNADYHTAHFNYDPVVPAADETWTVNKGFRTTRHQLVFILDDLERERRISERYWNDICAHDKPIITTICDPMVRRAYPGVDLWEYPIHEVIDFYGRLFLRVNQGADKQFSDEDIRNAGRQVGSYLHNSIPMILAYAGFIGVRSIFLWGADYDFPGAAIHEADKPNTEYWVGMLQLGLGVSFRMSARTTLLSTHKGREIYGYYGRQPMLDYKEPLDK